jgi:hypothetical protein
MAQPDEEEEGWGCRSGPVGRVDKVDQEREDGLVRCAEESRTERIDPSQSML